MLTRNLLLTPEECLQFFGNRDLTAAQVQARDDAEMAAIPGASYEAIARRMRDFIVEIKSGRIKRGNLIFGENVEFLVGGEQELGYISCPFAARLNCGGNNLDDTDYEIRNKTTGRAVRINNFTVHFARIHHLLEKNPPDGREKWGRATDWFNVDEPPLAGYGISPREFYENFM
jgi:hypothetical protein